MENIAKHDEGKLQIHLVPTQIIRDIAEVRMYGNAKYGSPDNWKQVEKWRYVDALLRHLLLYLDDPDGIDKESGIKHYKHAACNMAFICEMEAMSTSGFSPKENDELRFHYRWTSEPYHFYGYSEPRSCDTCRYRDDVKAWNAKKCDECLFGSNYRPEPKGEE